MLDPDMTRESPPTSSARPVEFPSGVAFDPPADHRHDARTVRWAFALTVAVACAVALLGTSELALVCALAGTAGALSATRQRRHRAVWAALTLRGCEVLALADADGGVNAKVRYQTSTASMLDARFRPTLEHHDQGGERLVAVALGGPDTVVELHDPVGVLALDPADAAAAARLVASDGAVEVRIVFAQRPSTSPSIAAVTLRSALGELRTANPQVLD